MAFALEVEGYRVESHDSWKKARASITPTFCTVADVSIFRKDAQARKALLEPGARMVVLSDGLFPPPPHIDAQVLTKPLETVDLLRAISALGDIST
jgi:hypothetical protein